MAVPSPGAVMVGAELKSVDTAGACARGAALRKDASLVAAQLLTGRNTGGCTSGCRAVVGGGGKACHAPSYQYILLACSCARDGGRGEGGCCCWCAREAAPLSAPSMTGICKGELRRTHPPQALYHATSLT